MSKKQLLIDLDEYNKDVSDATDRGFSTCITMVKDILDTGGVNVTVDKEKASPDLVKFIDYLKDINGKLRKNTTSEIN